MIFPVAVALGQAFGKAEMPVLNGTASIIPKGTICRFYTAPADVGASAPLGANASSWTAGSNTPGSAATAGPVGCRYSWVKPMDQAGTTVATFANQMIRQATLCVALADIPASGGQGRVAIFSGDCEILAGGTITDGDFYGVNASGAAITLAADDSRVLGQAHILTSGNIPGGTVAAAARFRGTFMGIFGFGVGGNVFS